MIIDIDKDKAECILEAAKDRRGVLRRSVSLTTKLHTGRTAAEEIEMLDHAIHALERSIRR